MHRDECTVCRDGGNRGSLKCISKSEAGRRRWLGPAWWTSPKQFSLEKMGQIKNGLHLVKTHSAAFGSESSERAVINVLQETFCYILPPVLCRQRRIVS